MDFQGISDCDERTQRNIVVSAFDGLNRGLPNPKLFAPCNIKCERTNTTSNDGCKFYRIYFFVSQKP